MNIRENWRIALLVVFVVASTIALFAPIGQSSAAPPQNATAADNGTADTADAQTSDVTNLQYGLELAGGTRVRAPLIGLTAEGLDFSVNDTATVRRTVAQELDVSTSDVNVRAGGPQSGGSVEVLRENVTQSEFAAALQQSGFDVTEEDVREGVTQQTREQTRQTLEAKINNAGLSGGSVSVTTAATGEKFVVVEVPNANRSQVLNLIGDRGVVEIVAHYPVETENGTEYRNTTVLTHDQLQRAQVGVAEVVQGEPSVPVTLAEQDARNYSQTLVEAGFTSREATRGAGVCRNYGETDDPGYCLLTRVDGEVIEAHSITPGLASDLESGDFTQNPSFRMTAPSMSEARSLQVNLEAGALPAELDVDEGTEYFIESSRADRFKGLALVTGLVAWLAVAGSVFLRYKRSRIAIPMLLTAGAEVYLLLGFAAAVGLALDLSHIAGLIAVIGTGVDDLVIIADEILQEGKVATGRVFQNRFRKAFWVIGAAAITTIIAMSPLAALSLGDLTGFAIVTIVGVLLGVLVTRPAYGDVLRNILIDEEHD